MLTISIQQPWAWAILCAGKDIENRTWPTKVRGRVLVHAGKRLDQSGVECLWDCYHLNVPSHLPLGGIVGSVEIVDCVASSASEWFFGKYGFVLRSPRVLEFMPCRGQLGFFDVQYNARLNGQDQQAIAQQPHECH